MEIRKTGVVVMIKYKTFTDFLRYSRNYYIELTGDFFINCICLEHIPKEAQFNMNRAVHYGHLVIRIEEWMREK